MPKIDVMKKIILSVFISALLTAFLFLLILEIQAQRKQLSSDEQVRIESRYLKEERKILVHLPLNYSTHPERYYPVAYVMDGSSKDFLMADINTVLSSAGVSSEMIIVGIPNTNRNRDLTPPFLKRDLEREDLGAGDQFLQFLQEELVPAIDAKYRTTDQALLVGHSRAGLFSLYAYLEAPASFDAYFCLSPAFWREDHKILERAKEQLISTPTLIYCSLGGDENDKMKAGFKKVTDFLQMKEDSNFQVEVDLVEGANHQTNPYYSLPKALIAWSNYQAKPASVGRR